MVSQKKIHPKPWGRFPFWQAYISNRLVQPPTRQLFSITSFFVLQFDHITGFWIFLRGVQKFYHSILWDWVFLEKNYIFGLEKRSHSYRMSCSVYVYMHKFLDCFQVTQQKIAPSEYFFTSLDWFHHQLVMHCWKMDLEWRYIFLLYWKTYFFFGKEICLWWVPKSRFHHELKSQPHQGSLLGSVSCWWKRWGRVSKVKIWFSGLTIFWHVFPKGMFKLLSQHDFFRSLFSPFGKYLVVPMITESFETTGFQLEPRSWPLQNFTSSWFLFNELKNCFLKNLWILQPDMKSEQNLRFFWEE